MKTKTLILDIENAPALAYVYQLFKTNVGIKQVLERPYILSYAAKWLGTDDIIYEDNQHNDDTKVVTSLFKLLDEADVAVAHFGDRHDFPFILGRGAVLGLDPPSPYHTVDTCKVARSKFKFVSNSLENLAIEFGITPKDGHSEFDGFTLWKEVLKGNPKAWAANKTYNIGDVITLEELYLKMLPYISNHPNVSRGQYECPKCGSEKVVKQGYYTSKSGLRYQQYQCKGCGGWSTSPTSTDEVPKAGLRGV